MGNQIKHKVSRVLSLIAATSLVAFAGVRLASERAASRPNPEADAFKKKFQRPERVPFPPSNAYSEAKYQLGKRLFNDPRLSGSGQMSCASCHDSSHAWTDGDITHSMKLGRRVPTLINVAWGWSYFWDGRAATLEEQALGPIQNPNEMNLPLDKLVERVGAVPDYREAFAKAFPNETLSPKSVARAIATFERTIVAPIAPFDRWIAGDESAISESAKRGFVLFNTTAGCVKCHTGWSFTNGVFADIGLPSEDLGRGAIMSNPYLRHTFKAPTLRELGHRSAYMHDGSLKTLAEVVDHYDRGGRVDRETAKLFIRPLNLKPPEKEDLLAFLKTLDSEDARSISLVWSQHRKGKP